MRRVLLRYSTDPGSGFTDEAGIEQLRTLFNEHGWTVVEVFAEGPAAHVVVERWGAVLDPVWPIVAGMALEAVLAAPEVPDPVPPERRRVSVRSDATGVRASRWERIVIRSDGRAEVEFVGGVASALAAVETERRGDTIAVTLQLGHEPLPPGTVIPAVGIDSVADVVLPVRVVDGARHRID